MKITESLLKRFWEKVSQRGPDDCWEWTAFTNQDGYGRLSVGLGSAHAHRISWVIHNGPIPGGMCVCHSCDNPPCVNPAHLWLGTQGDNILDMMEKGRVASGIKSGKSKLTVDQVNEIRRLYATGNYSYSSLAKKYGVGTSNIGAIVCAKIWRNIPVPAKYRRSRDW